MHLGGTDLLVWLRREFEGLGWSWDPFAAQRWGPGLDDFEPQIVNDNPGSDLERRRRIWAEGLANEDPEERAALQWEGNLRTLPDPPVR